MSSFDIPVPGGELLLRSTIGIAPLADFGDHVAIAPAWGGIAYWVDAADKYRSAVPRSGGAPRSILSALPEEVLERFGRHPWPRLQFLQVLFDRKERKPAAALQVVIPRDPLVTPTVGRLYWGNDMSDLSPEDLGGLAPFNIASLDDGGRRLMQEKLVNKGRELPLAAENSPLCALLGPLANLNWKPPRGGRPVQRGEPVFAEQIPLRTASRLVRPEAVDGLPPYRRGPTR